MRRCCATSASRTAGSVDTRDAASDTHGSRMRSVTSSPSSEHALAELDASAARDLGRVGAVGSARQATARYIAPVSR